MNGLLDCCRASDCSNGFDRVEERPRTVQKLDVIEIIGREEAVPSA